VIKKKSEHKRRKQLNKRFEEFKEALRAVSETEEGLRRKGGGVEGE